MKDRQFRFTALIFSFFLALVFLGQTVYGWQPGFQAGVSPLWKFFTSFLGHSGPEHLFNNIFFIALFGSIYELMTDEKTLMGTFLISALVGNLTAFIFFPNSVIIGASGGAVGILAALAVYRPNKIGLVFGVPAPMWVVLLGYIALNLLGLGAENNVAYEAHLFGMFAGAAVGLYLRNSEERAQEDSENDLEEEEWRDRIRRWEEKWMM
ncbi:rhomboid family intramembrane serine protease [Candidatus Nanohalovita haloferacivicina]|uniref:rhomboid family intramembrane serine protease n=1 Tax=Candidatus Nanohalovita haloferacivicina TaxID=2978046 RepID=UPI00325FA07D|nr:Rhomboid family protein [Candidatus Nanohalobia archaeon BNXNv]